MHIRIGALGGNEIANVAGNAGAQANGKLTGAAGAETIQQKGMGGGLPFLWDVDSRDSGTQFFTGTPSVENIFFTYQNGSATFTHGTAKGSFQGNPLCAAGGKQTTACFGNANPLLGGALLHVAGSIFIPVPLGVIGGGGTSVAALGTTDVVFLEGAQWISGSAAITNIAVNIITITNTANGRAGATGVGFTLQATVNENTDLQAENGVTVVTVAGSTAFETTNATSGINQVTLVSPLHIEFIGDGNPPFPGMGLQVLRYVPEPGTMLLLGSAVAGLLIVGRKRMKR